IAGRPNVGKSSLMNALLRHDRVIVAPVAGTTRDVIEESIEISGIRIRLSDTAGIIDTTDRVEMEGIRRSRQKLVSAQAVIFIVDASVPIGPRDEEIYGFLKDKPHIIAANKSDVAPAWGLKEASVRFPSSGAIVSVSALKRTGLDALEDALAGILGAPEITAIEGPIITNERHALIIEQASSALSRAVFLAQRGYNAELIASDLNEVIGLLGMITGEAAGDDVLERIFSKFCVGK
ncbi:MAG: 50S ribosome-binding GTPase, partial [Candidatus Omnitrophica bacterium]|nr:50S ribosome-binding GTPase [Candidatus Omnitrophota bacterium]